MIVADQGTEDHRGSLAQRELENEVMDTPQEARDYDAMDHAEVNRIFVDDFLTAWTTAGNNLSQAVDLVDLGTGTAQIPILLCTRLREARVVALDAAEHMLEVARDNVNRAGLSGRIQLQRADAKRVPLADESFAAVLSNSIVHHIPEPRRVLAEALRILKSGGLVFMRDLLRPTDETALRHLLDTYTAGANDHQRQMFDASLRAALNLAEIRVLIADLGIDPTSVQTTSDRHWTWTYSKRPSR